MTAKIYKNLLSNAVALASSSPTFSWGSPVNAVRGTTFNLWAPSGVGSGLSQLDADYDAGEEIIADYFLFDHHTLNFSGNMPDSISLIASNSSDFSGAVTLATILEAAYVSGINIKTFTNSTAYRYYRFRMDNGSIFGYSVYIATIFVGTILDLPNGIKPSYVPPPFGVNSKILNNISDSGQFLGKSVRRSGYEFFIKNDLVTTAWIRANWLDLLEYIERYPFYYSWNHELYPQDIVYGWTVGDIKPPRYNDQQYHSFSFKCSGFITPPLLS